ncbi:MAG: GGDEF domain-containing protein [Christensenellaceae bacterium]
MNDTGFIRGGTQQLVKKELQDVPDDMLIETLDAAMAGLIDGVKDVPRLQDKAYSENLLLVQETWEKIKQAIGQVRQGEGRLSLYNLSEEHFSLADRAVASAERFYEKQGDRSINLLIGLVVAAVGSIAVVVFFYGRTVTLRKRTQELDKIAYVDPLTQLPNQAGCEKQIAELKAHPPGSDVAVFMFEVNRLRRVNDTLGPQMGDRIVAEFGNILRTQAEGFGFVGRFCGVTFFGAFPDANDDLVDEFLMRVNEKVVSYNLLHVDEVEKISFAVGHATGNPKESSIENLIAAASGRMNTRKKQMMDYME